MQLNGSRQTMPWSDGGGGALALQHIGVFRVGQNNSAAWYLDANGNGVWGALDFSQSGFGIGTYEVAVGDWNGDRITDPGTMRFTNSYAWWYFDSKGNRKWDSGTDLVFPNYGIPGDQPMGGVWW